MKLKKKLTKTIVAGIAMAACILSFGGTANAAWSADSVGWWWTEGNSYPTSEWRMIDGTWYWFDASGYMATGWRNIGGTWYYLNASGAMAHDSWVGNYYVDPSGAMLTNSWIGNYYVGADGAWIPGYAASGWLRSNGRWWYSHADGSYTKNGWELINGSWYYFDAAGWMLSDCWVGNYYVGSSGAMLTDSYTPDGYYVNAEGVWTPVWHPGETTKTWVVDKKAWTEERTMYISVQHDFCHGCGLDLQQSFVDIYGENELVKCISGTFNLCYYDPSRGYIGTKETITLTPDEDARDKFKTYRRNHAILHEDKGEPSGSYSDGTAFFHSVKTDIIEHPEEGHWETKTTEGYWK